MIEGEVTARRAAMVACVVLAFDGTVHEIQATLDTGFT